jgi:hypothetical protein
MKKISILCICLLTSFFGYAQHSVLISPSGTEALKFNNTVTEKITLYDNGPASKYGMGISFAQFKFYVATTTDDFLFGVGSNTTFAEKFRVKGNGVLQTKNRIQLADAGGGESAGLWFNSNGNTGFNTFVGIDPSNQFGIYSPILFKNVFLANMANGGIRLEGPSVSSPAVSTLSLGGFGKVEVDRPGIIGGRMTILENGNVGIGTNTPGGQLTIKENLFGGRAYFQSTASGNGETDGLMVGQVAGNASAIYNNENTDLLFATNGTYRMKLTATGDLEFFGAGKIVTGNTFFAVLQNGWVNTGGYTSAAYYKDKEGRVHIKGTINGGTIATNTVIFTLPVGFRPQGGESMFIYVPNSIGAPALGAIQIDGITGQVTCYSVSGNVVMSLDGISFRAD